MVREFKKQSNKLLIGIILALVIIISGCSSSTAPKKYYTGYDSINMKFMDDSPPNMFYYDSEACSNGMTCDYSINTIPIFVQVENRGSSNSYGALFIHGFDPNIVAIDGYTGQFNGISYCAYGTCGSGLNSRPVFGGWAAGNNYGFSVSGVDIGQALGLDGVGLSSISFQNINGQQGLSFSTLLGSDGARTSVFGALGLGSRGTQFAVGAVLNPITRGMFNTYGWNGGWIKTFLFEGRNPNNPGGGMDVIEFPATIAYLPPSLEEFRQRVMVTSCFDYATHASAMVCIDSQPYSNTKKACKPQTVSLGGGQGAPVAITSIEQKPGKGKTVFTINVRHNKKDSYDELLNYFSLYKCDPASGQTLKVNDRNIVYIGYVHLSDLDITMNCIPDQVIRLDESGTGQISCSVDLSLDSSAYQSPMEIELWYGYSRSIYKDILIKKI